MWHAMDANIMVTVTSRSAPAPQRALRVWLGQKIIHCLFLARPGELS